jgi:CheY-like chemotaxis protein
MEASRRQLLLVVDDETRATRILARMLREDGFDVEIVFDGAAAISRLSRAPIPDALVTDVRMPHVDGVAVAKYARSRRRSMPVVFVTGYPQLVALEADDLGASVVVTKPVDYTTLSQQLATLLGRGDVLLDALVQNGTRTVGD